MKGTGTQNRNLLKVLRPIFMAHLDPAMETIDGLVIEAFDYALQIDSIISGSRGEYRLSVANELKLKRTTFSFCQAVTKLIKLMHPAPLFHYTIKSHYLCHIGLIGSFTNPGLGSCEDGEDIMKVVKRLISSAARGNTPHGATRNAMLRYTYGLGFDLSRRVRPA